MAVEEREKATESNNLRHWRWLLLAGGLLLIPDAPQALSQAETIIPHLTQTPLYSGGEQYDLLWGALKGDQPLIYNMLLGNEGIDGNPFFKSLIAYRRVNGDDLPCSILFQTRNGQNGFGLRFCDDFVAGAFQLDGGGERPDVTPRLCAPPSGYKLGLYRRLMEAFEEGEEAPKLSIKRIMRGATPDCSYFMQEGIDPLPANPGDSPLLG